MVIMLTVILHLSFLQSDSFWCNPVNVILPNANCVNVILPTDFQTNVVVLNAILLNVIPPSLLLIFF